MTAMRSCLSTSSSQTIRKYSVLCRGGHFRQNSDIPIAFGLSNSYQIIGLTYLSDFNYLTSYIGLPIVQLLQELLKSIGQKMGNFSSYFYLSLRIFHRFGDFLANFRKNSLSCWHPYCSVGVHNVLLASLLILVLFLASLYYFWHSCCYGSSFCC